MIFMINLTDLNELKIFMEKDLDDSSEDEKLMLLIPIASNWIINWLNRKEFDYKQRVEYYDGNGTNKICLKAYPAFVDSVRTIQVIIDDNGGYGQIPGSFTGTPLTYGNDFFLQVDDSDGVTSHAGILIRNNDLWSKQRKRAFGLLTPFLGKAYGTIQVTYWGGYAPDNIPSEIRFAANNLVSRLNFLLPSGFELSGSTFQEQTVSIFAPQKNYLMSLVTPMIQSYRNLRFSR